MAGPPPAVAAVRIAVRRELADLPRGGLVLAACSGGADSLALCAGLAFVAPRAGLAAAAVTVDHHLQPGSAEQATVALEQAREAGLSRTHLTRVRSGRQQAAVGEQAAVGPEAAARAARYRALDELADRLGADAVLLGHSRDDQAETVLLGLARGSGARSLAGMPRRRGRYRRPLLDLPRTTLAAACAALGLTPWQDPHNRDPAYTRARVRAGALPALEAALGPGVAAALARTARLLRADADVLDTLAEQARRAATRPDGGLDVATLAGQPTAIRTRVLRAAAVAAGAPAGRLSAAQLDAVDALVTGWHGQGPVALPGRLAAVRRHGRLGWEGSAGRE